MIYTSSSENLRRFEEESNFKDNLRKKGIIPILKDKKIYIYQVKPRENAIIKLFNELDENLFDIYTEVCRNDRELKIDLCRTRYIPYYRNLLRVRATTKEEILENFHLNNEKNINSFLNSHAKEIEMHIPVDDKTYTKAYRKETIDEVIERLVDGEYYVTLTFKRPSKLSEIVRDMYGTEYIDLDDIAKYIVEFLYDKKVEFSTGGILTEGHRYLEKLQFSDKEKSLPEEEKLSIIGNIISTFSIKCVMVEDINKMTKYQLRSFFDTESKKIITDFSKHNADILYNSQFSETTQKIIEYIPKKSKPKSRKLSPIKTTESKN